MPSHLRKRYIDKERFENIVISRGKHHVVVAQHIVVFWPPNYGNSAKMA